MDIGKSIRVACAMKDMTQKELAEASNISDATISYIVNGKSCKEQMLKNIAGAFEMKVSEFIALGE